MNLHTLCLEVLANVVKTITTSKTFKTQRQTFTIIPVRFKIVGYLILQSKSLLRLFDSEGQKAIYLSFLTWGKNVARNQNVFVRKY